ncbi:hypothetical protein C4K02_3748 [Pseudomonas synxantha]|nr:hypothetical protein C4K02_3748 [Pseudomonas synxantha]
MQWRVTVLVYLGDDVPLHMPVASLTGQPTVRIWAALVGC